ncbi:kinase-like domain-containing protein [Massariosphaeria phaeospora]|uniref:Kinase-like domain-containing protein n=1 Tax=Massariosphaeria phaeospora TaxID=100035 RepID=A0A7C8HZZ2_9PLEO|nr:kinase-like domain-containing protein [Massariosphaeria phaeospora]
MALEPTHQIDQSELASKITLGGFNIDWTTEPSVEVVEKLVRKHLALRPNAQVKVTPFTASAFNSLFAVYCSKGQFIMRVTLPVAPKVKTSSEVATLLFIREKTDIPVPQIMAYDANVHNELGFEWILMERIAAVPLREKWAQMSWLKKAMLVQKMVHFQAQLFRQKLSNIGNLYKESDARNFKSRQQRNSSYDVGEVVLPWRFVSNPAVHRGPYKTSQEYVGVLLRLLLNDANKYLRSDDEDNIKQGENMRQVHDKLQIMVNRLFVHSDVPEVTALLHRDLNDANILVSEEGDLVGIVDWECVAAVPLWQACRLPQFLEGPTCDKPPTPPKGEAPDNMYMESLEVYEQKQLRKFFLEEMQRVEPEWMRMFQTERLRTDILLAIEVSDNEFIIGAVKQWLSGVVQGRQVESLTDAIRNSLRKT